YIYIYSRTCGNVVCYRCSQNCEMINNKNVKICTNCFTYLKIRRSGDKPENIVEIINKCLLEYVYKWNEIRALLNAHNRLLKIIQEYNKKFKQNQNQNQNQNNTINSLNSSSNINNINNIKLDNDINDYHFINKYNNNI